MAVDENLVFVPDRPEHENKRTEISNKARELAVLIRDSCSKNHHYHSAQAFLVRVVEEAFSSLAMDESR